MPSFYRRYEPSCSWFKLSACTQSRLTERAPHRVERMWSIEFPKQGIRWTIEMYVLRTPYIQLGRSVQGRLDKWQNSCTNPVGHIQVWLLLNSKKTRSLCRHKRVFSSKKFRFNCTLIHWCIVHMSVSVIFTDSAGWDWSPASTGQFTVVEVSSNRCAGHFKCFEIQKCKPYDGLYYNC